MKCSFWTSAFGFRQTFQLVTCVNFRWLQTTEIDGSLQICFEAFVQLGDFPPTCRQLGVAPSIAFLSESFLTLQSVFPVSFNRTLVVPVLWQTHSDLFSRRPWMQAEVNLHRRRMAGVLHLLSWPCASDVI